MAGRCLVSCGPAGMVRPVVDGSVRVRQGVVCFLGKEDINGIYKAKRLSSESEAPGGW